MSTELGNVQFKVKETLPDPYSVWIEAEPQSKDGALPGGMAGMGFTLYTNDITEAESIANFFNNNVHQVLILTKDTK